ncbi:MAG: flagellar biosynthetic protein FliR [Lachnospiraceae bacterium]|jgi:flagellar biosynthetic protein FliR|nr:flagellar biosynthetic protein FliR [Lachnospiraceae bacterium]
MLILLSLIIMRMTGAIVFNPIFGRNNVPARMKTGLILLLSLLLYSGFGGELMHQPRGLLEYGVMMMKELFVGFTLSFSMELAIMIIRFASAIMDFSMGLSMAQVYDPQFNGQVTVTSGIYYGFLVLLFFATNCHLRVIQIFFRSADVLPFGMVTLNMELPQAILVVFRENIAMGLQYAFPLIAIELVTEAAVGILMRMIPQINVFSVNFQIKIIVGLLTLLILFSPMSDRIYQIFDNMFAFMDTLLLLLTP